MALPIAPNDSNKRKHPGDDHSTTFVDLCDLPEHEDRKPKLNSDGEICEEDEELMSDEAYNEAQEDYPQRPAFDSALHDLDINIAALTRQLQDALKKHSFASEHLQSMKLKADEAIIPPKPERIMVAMVGATGAGKTSLFFYRWHHADDQCTRQELVAQRNHRHATLGESGMKTRIHTRELSH